MRLEQRRKDAERIAAVMVAELERKRLVAAFAALADKLAYPPPEWAGNENQLDKGVLIGCRSAAAQIRAILLAEGALTKEQIRRGGTPQ